MKKQEKTNEITSMEEISGCKKKIVELVEKIEDVKFLKRIFVSIRDYLNENE